MVISFKSMKAKKLLFLFAFMLVLAIAGFWGYKNWIMPEALEPFPVDSFLRTPMNFEGNRYTLNAEIDRQLKNEEGFGRLIVVREKNGDLPLVVFIPKENNANINIGQRYMLNVTIKSGGSVYVDEMRKF